MGAREGWVRTAVVWLGLSMAAVSLGLVEARD